MPLSTPGTKQLNRALSRFKAPKSTLRKKTRRALEKLKDNHEALRECFEARAVKAVEAAAQASSGSLAAAAEHLQSCKKHLAEMRRMGGNPIFVRTAESELALAESLYEKVATVSGRTGSIIADGNAFEDRLWSWFDELTEGVARALIEGKVADFAIVSASGTLIALGVAGGPTTIVLAAIASGILLAGDLVARLRKSKAADTEEARLEAATALIEAVANIADRWLKTLKVAR